jgi:hypothetical protein
MIGHPFCIASSFKGDMLSGKCGGGAA